MTGPDPDDDRPDQSGGTPDETLPLTHRPYGQSDDSPPVSPSGPSYTSPSGEPPTTPAPPTGPSYGAPPATSYGQPGGSHGQPPGQSPYGASPYAAGPAYGMGYGQAHGRATTAMVLGIISIASLVLAAFCCVTAPGFLTGPFAIWLGLSARKEIDANPSMYNNRGQAVAGFITGIIGTVLGVLAILAVALLIAAIGYSVDTSPYN